MADAVLDSSAVLALLLLEPGHERVLAILPGALISSVNVAEVLTKLCERGVPLSEALIAFHRAGAEVIDFDESQAILAAELREQTRALGLSLGDRACLALAKLKGLEVFTADQAWAKLDDHKVVLIRSPH